MRILILSTGSRGDVAPFTGLGVSLRRAGHEVVLAAHDRFADLVIDAGLEHRSLPGDPVELVRARTAAPTPEAAQSVFAAFLDELGDGVMDAVAADVDVVLTAFGPAPLSRLAADAAGIPSAGVYLAPGVPTREFAPPGWPGADRFTGAENLAAGRAALERTDALYADVMRRMRKRLGLQPDATPIAGPPMEWPIFHGYSPAFVPRPSDWPVAVHADGYWWPAAPPGWRPSDRLVDFLQAGPPPVFIGFGSMTPDHERLHEDIAFAVERARVRAVVQSGWAGLESSRDDILVIDEVPHEWLFPRVAAVVHHAGAGTTAAGLRAGIPCVPVPVLVDQPFWAERLVRAGVAPLALPMAELTGASLGEAIRLCLEDAASRTRAAELAHRIEAEDGAAPVLAFVDHLEAG